MCITTKTNRKNTMCNNKIKKFHFHLDNKESGCIFHLACNCEFSLVDWNSVNKHQVPKFTLVLKINFLDVICLITISFLFLFQDAQKNTFIAKYI